MRKNHIPLWFKNLSDGTYSLEELYQISGRAKTYLSRLMKRLGVPRQYRKNATRNIHQVFYTIIQKDIDNSTTLY